MSQVIVDFLRLPDDTEKWFLVTQFFALRTQVFIQKKQWDLRDDAGNEFEQYDTATVPTYAIAHSDGQVVGGARLIRCDTKFGSDAFPYTYMIRDAYFGRLGLPKELCFSEPPNDESAWELTRLVSKSNDRTTARLILDSTNRFLREQGAKTCLFLGPRAFLRMAKAYGYSPIRLGEVCNDESGSFLAFSCDVV